MTTIIKFPERPAPRRPSVIPLDSRMQPAIVEISAMIEVAQHLASASQLALEEIARITHGGRRTPLDDRALREIMESLLHAVIEVSMAHGPRQDLAAVRAVALAWLHETCGGGDDAA